MPATKTKRAKAIAREADHQFSLAIAAHDAGDAVAREHHWATARNAYLSAGLTGEASWLDQYMARKIG
jgi:hypothetical protein